MPDTLEKLFPAEILLTDPADCWAYGYDNSRHHRCPEAVVFARDQDDVTKLVRWCRENGKPLVARGRGTGTTGAAVPVRGGVVVTFERMNRILRVDRANRYAEVEAGVTNAEVQRAVGEAGFFWPPDPTSAAYCTVGGNLACNAAGPRAVKYGTPRDNVLGLRAVIGDGTAIRSGVYTTKGVVGYDLTRLLIGSEGTLGVITHAILKLTPKPTGKRTLRAVYRDVTSAAEAVADVMAQPVTPCALEFMDHTAIGLVQRYGGADLPAEAGGLLMIEVDGEPNELDSAQAAITRAATNDGLLDLRHAATDEEVQTLWAARKALSPAQRKAAPTKINEDVVVPVSHIPALVNGLGEISERFGILIVNFGHAGNGNLHVNLLYDPDNAEQAEAAPKCLSAVFSLVLSLQGTLSGEHGVGIEKREHVGREIDPGALSVMRAIKHCLDPDGILNPGKALPLEAGENAADYAPSRRL